MYLRNETRKITIGDISIGGGSPIAVQSMTNTDTRDAKATIEQILRLEDAGCDIIRVAVPDEAAAEAIKEIKKSIHIPLVADIHFNYKLALMCIENGIDKVRINPGNIGDISRTEAVTKMCKEHNIPIRIGINGGSLEKKLLEKYGGCTPEAIVESAMGHIDILESMDFNDIAISLKSSNVPTTIEAYRLMAQKRNYPLHIGITESGTVQNGTIKSSVGIGAILAMGIGDTIRVSLTGDPVEEVRVGRKILHSLELGGKKMIQFVSCPTCGRTRVDLIGTAQIIEQRIADLEAKGAFKKPLTVSVMGCAVNGPGEAKHSDIGLAGGENEFLMFIKGETVGKFKPDTAIDQFIDAVLKLGS